MSTTVSSLSRFQGCLMGVLIGDCLGGPFEGMRFISSAHLNKWFGELNNPQLKLPFKPFTDDTAMTKSVCLSLVNCKTFDPADMAKRFVVEYYTEHKKRGYGASIGDTFYALKASDFEDPYGPAKKQFGGGGSFGNGAAMRVSPLALYCYKKDLAQLLELVTLSSQITHSNKLGYRGAILQAIAIREALNLPSEEFNVIEFVDTLISHMKEIESSDKPDEFDLNQKQESYVDKLQIVKKYLQLTQPPPREEIDESLGISVAAHRSVPTAIYSFLACQKAVTHIETQDKFQRSIQFAISLGGDTDTIASMCGAISGAHLGIDRISSTLMKRCEAYDDVLKWATDLHDVVHSNNVT